MVQWIVIERTDHKAAEGFVPPIDRLRPPTNFLQHPGKCARALPAPPAINKRPPAAFMVREPLFDVIGCIAKDKRSPAFARGEGGNLLVLSPDKGAFPIVQNRQVDRAGDVILGEFRGAPYVDDRIEPNGVNI